MKIFTLQNYLDFLKEQDLESLLISLPSLSGHLSKNEIRNFIDSGNRNFEKQIKIIESIFNHEKNLSIESIKRNVSTIAKYSNTTNHDVKKVIKSYLHMKKYLGNKDGTPPENTNYQALSSSQNS